jgi:aryl-alcohol dehydrogenase-like predicted oxidoreductase
MGCNRLGGKNQPDTYWIDLVRKAVDLGVTVFDTAEAYGPWYLSEEILGQAIGNRDDVAIATKICRVRETGIKDYSAKRVVERCEASLKRLQRDVIEIYQLHSPNREELLRFDWAEGMARLKRQGKIRAGAVAVSSAADAVYLMEETDVEVLQITYNILATDPEERVFDLAAEKGVGLLVRMPLARGVLTGKFRPGEEIAEGHRILLSEDRGPMIQKAEDLRGLGEDYPGGMTRMAHHFSLTPRAVSAIIPGARTQEQLQQNVSASNGRGLPEGWRERIDQIRAGWQ